MENQDLDQIKNKIVSIAAGENGERDAELNIVLDKFVGQRLIRKTPKRNHKQVYLKSYGGVVNYAPTTINVTFSPSEFNVTKIRELIITKTYGISFKPMDVIGFVVQTESNSTQEDPLIRVISKEHTIRDALHELQVDPKQELRITDIIFQFDNVHDYLLDFEIDDESTIVVSDKIINLKEFLTKNLYILPIGNKNHLRIEYLHSKFVLRNFPASHVIYDLDLEMSIDVADIDGEGAQEMQSANSEAPQSQSTD